MHTNLRSEYVRISFILNTKYIHKKINYEKKKENS